MEDLAIGSGEDLVMIWGGDLEKFLENLEKLLAKSGKVSGKSVFLQVGGKLWKTFLEKSGKVSGRI